MITKIRYTKQGKGYIELSRDIDFQFITIENGLVALGEETKTHMQTIIQTSKKRSGSKNELENSIRVHKQKITANRIDVGVGKKSELPKYWAVINYGGYSGAALSGKKVPGSFGGSPPNPSYKGTGIGHEKYDYARGGPYFMKVESPIMAMNYIDKTIVWANTISRVHYSNWNNKIKVI